MVNSRKPATDWKTLIQDAVAEDKPKILTTGLRLDTPSNRVIRKAAQRRGMSPAAFIRRAAVAVALHDLDQIEQWGRINADEPGFTAFGRPMGQAPYRPQGHGFGPWKITRMEQQFPDD